MCTHTPTYVNIDPSQSQEALARRVESETGPARAPLAVDAAAAAEEEVRRTWPIVSLILEVYVSSGVTA